MNNIELFFQEPNNFIDKQPVYSTLFLLRRDILTCFGFNPNNNSNIDFQALFPGTMGIMAGIDLLSKFYFTDAEKQGNKSSDRFKGYVKNYIDDKNEEILYQLRNSLLHSFGLYSIDRKGKEYNFILDQNLNYLIKTKNEKNYLISVRLLRDYFEKSINKYKNDILNNPDLKVNFELMFQKYGLIGLK